MISVKLLAGARLESAAGPLTGPATQRRRLALLALLAGHPEGVSRDRLIGYLWPERDGEHARNLLSQAVYALRRELGEGAIGAAGDELRLDRHAVSCDLLEFAAAAAAGDNVRVVELYAGPFLDGFYLSGLPEFEQWVEQARERYRRAYCSALERLAADAARTGDARAAVEWWRRLAAAEPGNARVALRLMEALDAAGDRAGAIRHARVHAALMADELEAAPDAEVMAFAERLRRSSAAAPGEAGNLHSGEERAAASSSARMPAARSSARESAPAPSSPHDSAGARPADEGAVIVAPAVRARRDSPVGWRARALRIARKPRVLVVASLAALAVASGWLIGPVWTAAQRTSGPLHSDGVDAQRIVVLPFQNLSGNADEEYFSDGLTEELMAVLARVHSLRVVARTSAFTLRAPERDARAIGRALDVGFVLEGSVRREGDRVRVWARLVDAESGVHLWSNSYDRELTDVFGIWTDVAERIALALQTELTPADRMRLVRRFDPSPAAHASYLKGRHAWQQRTPAGNERAIAYFQRAIALEPRYAEAYAGVAITSILQGIYGHATPHVAGERARTAALRALELDDRLAEAHAAYGGYLNSWAFDAAAAESAWQRAIALDPSYAYVRHIYGILLASTGRFEDALVQRRRAVELDPLDPHLNTQYATALLKAGRPDEALQYLQTALELDSLYWQVHSALGDFHADAGRSDEALRAHRRAVALAGGSASAEAGLGIALARAGRSDEARRILDALEARAAADGIYTPNVAALRAELHDVDGALAWLERAYRQRHPGLALLTPEGPLAADARYADLLRRVGRR